MNTNLLICLAAYYLILAAVWLVRKIRETPDLKRMTAKERRAYEKYWRWCH